MIYKTELLTMPKLKTSIFNEITPWRASGAMYASVPRTVSVFIVLGSFLIRTKPKSPICQNKTLLKIKKQYVIGNALKLHDSSFIIQVGFFSKNIVD